MKHNGLRLKKCINSTAKHNWITKCSEWHFRGKVPFSRNVHSFYNLSCPILWMLAPGIWLRDPVDLVRWTFILLWDPADLGYLKFVLYWDPGDLGSCGSRILNFCFIVGSWRSCILAFVFAVGSWRSWILNFCLAVRSWRSWILTKWFCRGIL